MQLSITVKWVGRFLLLLVLCSNVESCFAQGWLSGTIFDKDRHVKPISNSIEEGTPDPPANRDGQGSFSAEKTVSTDSRPPLTVDTEQSHSSGSKPSQIEEVSPPKLENSDRLSVKSVENGDPELLNLLLEMERAVGSLLPNLQPCVVSIEGGTGVIVSSDGFILTASHVTKKAGRTVNVRFSDGRVLTATTLGTNFNNDTAAIRLNSPGPWPHVKLADSTLVQPGDWCIALGYPLSFPRGKPAAVRMGRVLQVKENELVTDCPIMGGDSGGPLLNLNGNLIGISSKVKNDITENLHIPVQVFQDDWQTLASSIDVQKIQGPTRKRAYLGILGETDVNCVRVRRVHRGSPAEIAGLLPDDVILQLDGRPVGDFDDVLEFLDGHQPGERVVAKLNRYGRLMSVPIKLGKRR